MKHDGLRYALLSQILLFAGSLVAVVLRPEFFFSLDQGGVSNYGVIPLTILPYTVALLGCGYYMMRSALSLPADNADLRDGRRVIFVVGVFYILMLLSTYPYQQSLVLTYVHQIISIMLVLIILLAGVWIYQQLLRMKAAQQRDIVVLLIGVVLGFLTVIDAVRVLFTAQIIVAIGFGRLYLHYMSRVHATVTSSSKDE